MKRGLIYLNLGTPDSPEPKDVKKYLKTFLMDEFVIDIPWFFRWILVNLIIAPTRSSNSSHAYKQIWTAKGSPLKVLSAGLVDKVAAKMGLAWVVRLAMRYGSPSIDSVLSELVEQGVRDIRLVLAYPQYALSSSETALQEVRRLIRQKYAQYDLQVQFVRHYERHPIFIQYWVEQIKKFRALKSYGHILFSYHGLPVKHVKKISPSCRGEGDCSLTETAENRLCYRRQCFATTNAIAQMLDLKPHEFSVGFQSRLTSGWIKPFSDVLYGALAARGVKNLLVLCPSFTVDCLETLEEINIRAKEEFKAQGGESLDIIPCLNDSADHVRLVTQLAEEANESLV